MARKITRPEVATTAAVTTVAPSVVRAWAREQGITEGYGTRGRMSRDLLLAFAQAHTPSGKPRKAAQVLADA